ncbi:MAG: DEAD/DEAH box helicase [Nitrospinota bacterium]|nr:DEAD/DEAH box helicase [Nitrospinota bacterium]MDH5677916.1 DEAD/DEAH box helicase [Nitrospinota bacterium]MDH5756183.1 DEAD/DEAH box helicase [Nitrospinota bacterium]
MGLIRPLLRALEENNYKAPTPIQSQAIPHILEGRDMFGCAQTGTGKTAAFALPILQFLDELNARRTPKAPLALVLAPTRELAEQINKSFRAYGRYMKIRVSVAYGGVGIVPQARALAAGVDVLVATPGRLLDLINQRMVTLDNIRVLTLDEADRMLDMGFINDIKKIIAKIPEERQTLFFSATFTGEAGRLANGLLNDPVRVQVSPQSSTVDRINQKVMFVDQHNKEALLHLLLEDESVSRALVFTRTKHRANKLVMKLTKDKVSAEAIHGNKSQPARLRALAAFSSGRVKVLVATDVASRGIDVKDVSHVINFEMPGDAESYVHRIGRTARAGQSGIAISLCDVAEHSLLRDIERSTKMSLDVHTDHPYHVERTPYRGPKSGPSGYKKPNGGGGAFRRGGAGNARFTRRKRPESRMAG